MSRVYPIFAEDRKHLGDIVEPAPRAPYIGDTLPVSLRNLSEYVRVARLAMELASGDVRGCI